MKQYVLIAVQDREILEPMFFDTHEEAREEIISEISNILGIAKAEVINEYDTTCDENSEDESCAIYQDTAYLNDRTDIDWAIFSISAIE